MFDCTDCKMETLKEWYMVSDSVWTLVGMELEFGWEDQFLCIGCLESRLGRRLTRSDFIDLPINMESRARSDRLESRLQIKRKEELMEEEYERERALQVALRADKAQRGYRASGKDRERIILQVYGEGYRANSDLAELVRKDLDRESREDTESPVLPSKDINLYPSFRKDVRYLPLLQKCNINPAKISLPKLERFRLTKARRFTESLGFDRCQDLSLEFIYDAICEYDPYNDDQASLETFCYSYMEKRFLAECKRDRAQLARFASWDDNTDGIPIGMTKTPRGGHRESALLDDLIAQSSEDELIELMSQREILSIKKDQLKLIFSELASWTAKDKDIIVSFYLHGESDAEVAERWGYKDPQRLRMQRSRLMKRLSENVTSTPLRQITSSSKAIDLGKEVSN